jgi:5-methylthioadenosine/S-adenosylhomocysteine deaminase
VEALHRLGVLEGRTVAAHAVWLTEEDMAILARMKTGVAHCPTSNMKLASGVAPVTSLLRLDIALGLGPDGPAGSNNDFNLFEEMDLAAKLQKVTRMDPEALPAPAAFAMATIGGARVLGLEKEIGSIEPGKRADIIVVRADQPHATPMFHPYSQLVYALKGSDVADVFINGRAIVRDRNVLTLPREQVMAEARVFAQKVSQSVRQR